MKKTTTFNMEKFREISKLQKDEIFEILSDEITRLHGIIATYEHHIESLLDANKRKNENYTNQD